MVTIDSLKNDRLGAIVYQTLLINLKLLCGPADGKVGPLTQQAISELLRITKSKELTPELLNLKVLPQPKLDLSKGDFAARIAKYMIAQGYWIDDLHPNIVYVEGVNTNGTPNADKMDGWNDVRAILEIKKDVPILTHVWVATTEPGRKYTADPLNPDGAFRIAFGQFRAWIVGWHKTHEALVQHGDVVGYRDKNKDGKRTGDTVVKGANFGINQHWGGNAATVGGWSAGCLVGQSTEDHLLFMKIVKSDPRYKANSNYVFLTTILPGDKL